MVILIRSFFCLYSKGVGLVRNCYWIKRYILTVCFAVLINDTLFYFLRSSQGVRQSFVSFSVIVMEALSKMVDASIESDFTLSFLVGAILYERVNISHILFVDYTLVSLFFGEF
jgi:hypothetical protein